MCKIKLKVLRGEQCKREILPVPLVYRQTLYVDLEVNTRSFIPLEYIFVDCYLRSEYILWCNEHLENLEIKGLMETRSIATFLRNWAKVDWIDRDWPSRTLILFW